MPNIKEQGGQNKIEIIDITDKWAIKIFTQKDEGDWLVLSADFFFNKTKQEDIIVFEKEKKSSISSFVNLVIKTQNTLLLVNGEEKLSRDQENKIKAVGMKIAKERVDKNKIFPKQ